MRLAARPSRLRRPMLIFWSRQRRMPSAEMVEGVGLSCRRRWPGLGMQVGTRKLLVAGLDSGVGTAASCAGCFGLPL